MGALTAMAPVMITRPDGAPRPFMVPLPRTLGGGFQNVPCLSSALLRCAEQ